MFVQFGTTLSFIPWQVGVRLLKGRVLIGWVDDKKMLVMHGEPSFTGNIYRGLMEFRDMALLNHCMSAFQMSPICSHQSGNETKTRPRPSPRDVWPIDSMCPMNIQNFNQQAGTVSGDKRYGVAVACAGNGFSI